MSSLSTALLIIGAWVVGALFVGVCVGRVVRQRDVQIDPALSEPRPPLVALPSDVTAPSPGTAHVEVERLLAQLDRAECNSGSSANTDLSRIWAARCASAAAERELNLAIEQARSNGCSWDTIKLVLELPQSTPQSAPQPTPPPPGDRPG